MMSKVSGSVVVITGASSGIGRATALRFARKGASVVLAARNAQALEEVASECRELGVQALAVPTDVTDEEAVRALTRQALENLGRIDVWVNNAAVTLFARFEEAPPDAWRQVIETNLFGYVHGARAALPVFREQGRGVLINNASVHGAMGAPYLSAYVTTKFAIRGLGECLRQELRGEDLHVVTVMPASIDTPIFQHAANFTGRALQPMPPVYSAEQVARAIVHAARRPQREVLVGAAGRRQLLARRLLPGVMERSNAHKVHQRHFQDAPAAPGRGNLDAPREPTAISGGWRRGRRRAGLGLLGGLLAVPALLGGWRWLGAPPRRLKQARRVARLGALALRSPRVRGMALTLLRLPATRRLALASVSP